jgi:hypothetical protein
VWKFRSDCGEDEPTTTSFTVIAREGEFESSNAISARAFRMTSVSPKRSSCGTFLREGSRSESMLSGRVSGSLLVLPRSWFERRISRALRHGSLTIVIVSKVQHFRIGTPQRFSKTESRRPIGQSLTSRRLLPIERCSLLPSTKKDLLRCQ